MEYMCGRYTLASGIDVLKKRFNVNLDYLNIVDCYNISPTQPVLCVLNEQGNRRAEMFKWGLIPSWSNDLSTGNRMINAREDTVAVKPTFKPLLAKRRCLILADGFYEWKQKETGKVPMRIVLKNQTPFAFAGLWTEWISPAKEAIRSCTIITTEPNSLVKSIHNRMPVILSEEAELLWLDPLMNDSNVLKEVLVPFPAESMEAYPVSKLGNSPKNDNPACIVPFS